VSIKVFEASSAYAVSAKFLTIRRNLLAFIWQGFSEASSIYGDFTSLYYTQAFLKLSMSMLSLLGFLTMHEILTIL